MTGPYHDLPATASRSTRGRASSSPSTTTRASATCPEHRRSASTPGRFSARSASSPASSAPGRRARAAGWSSRSPTPPPTWTGTASRRGRPTSVRSPRSPATPADNYERRAPGTAGMREGVRYQIYDSADGHVLFMASEQAFWKNFCEGSAEWTCSRSGRAAKYADHARNNRRCRPSCATSSRRRRPAEWIEFGNRVNTPIAPVNTPEDDRRRSAVPGPVPLDPRVAARRRRDAAAAQAHRRGAARPARGPRRSASTPTRCSQSVLGLRRRPHRGAARRSARSVAEPGSVVPSLRRRRYADRRVGRTHRARRAGARQAWRRRPAGACSRRRPGSSRATASATCASSTSRAPSARRPATFYQYFRDVEEAVLVVAEEVGEDLAPIGDLLAQPWESDGGHRRGARARRGVHGLLGRAPRRAAHAQPRGPGGRPAVPRRPQRVAPAAARRARGEGRGVTARPGAVGPRSRPMAAAAALVGDDRADGRVPSRARALRRRPAPSSSRPPPASSTRR